MPRRRSRVYYVASTLWFGAATLMILSDSARPFGVSVEAMSLWGPSVLACLSVVEMAVFVDRLEADRPDLLAEHVGSHWLWWAPTQWRLMWFIFSSEGDEEERLRDSRRAARAALGLFIATGAASFVLVVTR